MRRSSLIITLLLLLLLTGCFSRGKMDSQKAEERKNQEQLEQQAEKENREFIQRNESAMHAVKVSIQKLSDMLPSMGVIRKEVMEQIESLTGFMEGYDLEKLKTEWEAFQTGFSEQCGKIYQKVSEGVDIPKATQKAEATIVEILREVEKSIQEMNK